MANMDKDIAVMRLVAAERPPEPDPDQRYEIVRFRFEGENEVLRSDVSLEEAQEWCNDESTHGEGWFDGYRRI